MKLTINKRTLATVLSTLFAATDAVVVETDNINGNHTVYAGDHYADGAWFGNNWGDNGEQSWYVKVTFSDSAASYSGGSCFASTVEFYDWNKVRDLLLLFTRSMRHEEVNSPQKISRNSTHHKMYHYFLTSPHLSYGGKLDADTLIIINRIAIALCGDVYKISILHRIVGD